MGFQGIDIRQTGERLLFRAFLQDSSGALITSGTTTVKIYEAQSDGTLKSYDFNDNTFKTTALTTETLAMTHRQGNNSTTNTGLWTAGLATLTGFTAGNIYFALVNNSGASPTDQMREFQFGNASGSLNLFTAGVLLDSTATSAQLVDDIWDEALVKVDHDVNNSAAKRLRTLTDMAIRSETAQGPGTGNNQIQLDTGASAIDGAYDPAQICIIAGTGLGQSRLILQYDGTTKTATVDRDWKVSPDATSEYVITCNPGREHVNEGLAQAGASLTITLNSLASSTNDTYVGSIVFIRSGTGQDQSRIVTAYNGTTKVATIDVAWAITPDTTSAYVILPAQLEVLPDLADGGRLDLLIDNLSADSDFLLKCIKNKKDLVKESSTWYLYVYDDDSSTPILKKAIKDYAGNDINDLAAGNIASEIKTTV